MLSDRSRSPALEALTHRLFCKIIQPMVIYKGAPTVSLNIQDHKMFMTNPRFTSKVMAFLKCFMG